MAYRFYISDCLYYQAREKTLNARYYDLVTNPKPQDNRSAEEIAVDIIKRAELEVVE